MTPTYTGGLEVSESYHNKFHNILTTWSSLKKVIELFHDINLCAWHHISTVITGPISVYSVLDHMGKYQFINFISHLYCHFTTLHELLVAVVDRNLWITSCLEVSLRFNTQFPSNIWSQDIMYLTVIMNDLRVSQNATK